MYRHRRRRPLESCVSVVASTLIGQSQTAREGVDHTGTEIRSCARRAIDVSSGESKPRLQHGPLSFLFVATLPSFRSATRRFHNGRNHAGRAKDVQADGKPWLPSSRAFHCSSALFALKADHRLSRSIIAAESSSISIHKRIPMVDHHASQCSSRNAAAVADTIERVRDSSTARPSNRNLSVPSPFSVSSDLRFNQPSIVRSGRRAKSIATPFSVCHSTRYHASDDDGLRSQSGSADGLLC